MNAAGVMLLAVQELDRAPDAKSHTYARQLLAALGAGWSMIQPTTAWNENYLFWRQSAIRFKAVLPDLILTSAAGGRHATRAVFEIAGKDITVMSTHLVSGAGNSYAREVQGEQLATVADGSTLILGDLNQKGVPKALVKSHKTARVDAGKKTNAQYGTFAKWADKHANDTQFLDHILPPAGWNTLTYEVHGIGADGLLVQPRVSDHLLITSLIEIKE